jgi:hypothetical protein
LEAIETASRRRAGAGSPCGTIRAACQRGTAPFGQRSDQGNTLFLKATTVF